MWTYKGRVAFVLSVTENGRPIQDDHRLQRLRQLLLEMVDAEGQGIVNIKQVSLLNCFRIAPGCSC